MLDSLVNMLVLRNETGLSCLEQLGDLFTSIPQSGKLLLFFTLTVVNLDKFHK